MYISIEDDSNSKSIEVELLSALYSGFGIKKYDQIYISKILNSFGCIGNIISSDVEILIQFGMCDDEIKLFSTLNSTLHRALFRKNDNRIHMSSLESVVDYLHLKIAHLKYEVFRILFLNSRYKLICDKIISTGTVDLVNISPRIIVSTCLDVNAKYILLSHNHPSGDSLPSREDIQITEKIKYACSVFDIKVLDHIIISTSGYTSLKSQKLM